MSLKITSFVSPWHVPSSLYAPWSSWQSSSLGLVPASCVSFPNRIYYTFRSTQFQKYCNDPSLFRTQIFLTHTMLQCRVGFFSIICILTQFLAWVYIFAPVLWPSSPVICSIYNAMTLVKQTTSIRHIHLYVAISSSINKRQHYDDDLAKLTMFQVMMSKFVHIMSQIFTEELHKSNTSTNIRCNLTKLYRLLFKNWVLISCNDRL